MTNKEKNTHKQETDTVLTHTGNNPDEYHGFVNPPVVRASTVLFPNYETMSNRSQKYTYGTRGTPTSDALCEVIDEMEGSAGTVIVPSGLAAATIPLLAFAKAGDHVLVTDSVYTPTRDFCDEVLIKYGVEIEYFDPLIGSDIKSLMRPNTSIVFTESPASNTFELQDIPAIVEVAHAQDAVVMIDNTWATPLYFNPMEHGVDISIHALTKYPGGHSDLVLGSVSANEKCWKQLHRQHGLTGCCATADDCYLALRGIRSMGVRIREHEKNSIEIANWLDELPCVSDVLHPALPSHPQHDLWKRDFKGSTGLFGFTLNTQDKEKAVKFYDALKLIGRGYSWAGYESLAVLVDLSDRTIAKGSDDGMLVRLNVGLEDPKDIKADIEQAMRHAGFIN